MRSRVRLRRTLIAAVLAVLAVAGLSACQNKVGLAASVGSHRIRESDLGKYVTPTAVPFTVQGQTGPSTIVPKVYALRALIATELFEQALADTKGGRPSEADVSAAKKSLTNGASVAQQNAAYTKYGFTPALAQLDLRYQALFTIFAQRVGATNDAGPILAALDKLKIPISVSGRYGSWNPKTLSISETGGIPSFIRPAATATATAP